MTKPSPGESKRRRLSSTVLQEQTGAGRDAKEVRYDCGDAAYLLFPPDPDGVYFDMPDYDWYGPTEIRTIPTPTYSETSPRRK